MTRPVPLAFYAPLKSPDHPSPSGDRSVARLLLAALATAGFRPEVVSRLRSYDGLGDPARQAELRERASREAEQLGAALAASPARPRVWCTYHSYYKAPDWIGPVVSRRLGIPYVLAESTRAGKRAGGPWAVGHAGAEAALDTAELVFVLTRRDRKALNRARPAGQRLVDLPPFVEASAWPSSTREADATPPQLVAVGMMREGDKLASYRQLAEALHRLAGTPWHLDIVGGGPAEEAVAALFAPFGERVTHHGVLAQDSLAALYRRSDLLVWPAVNEAFGMAPLEAQAAGCPVVVGDHGGVRDALQPGQTGLLVPRDDPAALAEAVAGLLAEPARRAAMSARAAAWVRAERDVGAAAEILRRAIEPLLRCDRAS